MDLLKIASPTPKTFQPKAGRTYHCDNYTLVTSPSTGKRKLLLDGRTILTSDHPRFTAIIESFDWKTYQQDDTIIVEDHAELFDEHFINLSEWLSSDFDLPITAAEAKREYDVTSRVLGFYSEL